MERKLLPCLTESQLCIELAQRATNCRKVNLLIGVNEQTGYLG